jgi:hypothetical protein
MRNQDLNNKATEICEHTIQEEQLPFRVVHNGSDTQGKVPIVFEGLAHSMFLTLERVWAGVYEKRSMLDGQGIEKCWKAIMSTLGKPGDGLS